jgi:putative NADPH-quinone reductase/putative sterol carrier protein
MNCVVIKASPRGSRAGSSRAAAAFVRGLNAADKEVDVTQLLLSKLKIRHCTGCYSCWTRTPGRCAQRDDMDRVLPALAAADLVVYALPLYYYSVPGALKDVIDRSLPLLCPQLVSSGDATGHPRRTGQAPRLALIATCGFPERAHFDPLLQLVRQWTANPDDEIVGTILIPAAEPMAHDDMQAGFRKLYDLIERAGRETANSGRVSPETEQLIKEDHEKRIGSAESFRAVANAYWESAQSSRGGSADEMRADSSSRKDPECSVSAGGMETLMAAMALRYSPPAADREMTAIMQFDFEGDGYYLMISSGTCHAYRGFHPDPTFTVRSPVAVWEAVADGTLEGAAGLVSGRYHVDGDM